LPVRLVFTAAARDDVVEAQDWYAERSAALGRRFRRALDRAVFGIVQNPLGFPVVWRDRVRRALVLDRFPTPCTSSSTTTRSRSRSSLASTPVAIRAAGRSARDGFLDLNLSVSQPPLKRMTGHPGSA
jgi:hypothetical protein